MSEPNEHDVLPVLQAINRSFDFLLASLRQLAEVQTKTLSGLESLLDETKTGHQKLAEILEGVVEEMKAGRAKNTENVLAVLHLVKELSRTLSSLVEHLSPLPSSPKQGGGTIQ